MEKIRDLITEYTNLRFSNQQIILLGIFSITFIVFSIMMLSQIGGSVNSSTDVDIEEEILFPDDF